MEPETTSARRTIEQRYGPIGTGGKILFLRGVPMGLGKIARKLALAHQDLVPIDAGTLPDARHWIRLYEGEQRKVIVLEFDGEFNLLAECGADIRDWIGDEYFKIHWRVFCPAGGEEWLGADASKGKAGRR